jgi:hypothetical protein
MKDLFVNNYTEKYALSCFKFVLNFSFVLS